MADVECTSKQPDGAELTGTVDLSSPRRFKTFLQQFPGVQGYGEVREKFHISQPCSQKRNLSLVVLIQLAESKTL